MLEVFIIENFFTARFGEDGELARLARLGLDESFHQAERDMRCEARGRGAKPPPRCMLRKMTLRALPCARMLSEYWLSKAVLRAGAPPPKLYNTDGESMLSCEFRFPIAGDAAKVATSFDGIGEFARKEGESRWRWVAPGSPLHRMAERRTGKPVPAPGDDIGAISLGYAEFGATALTLSVNSRERVVRGREILASDLGDLVGPPLISYQNPERALEEHAGQELEEPAILFPANQLEKW